MRILHTADWHLGDRLGRVDRTEDLRRAVERIARYCQEHEVDVLLIVGDLFSDLSRPDGLRGSIEHLYETFQGFLRTGGTIVAVTGNHDHEGFCQTLRHAFNLAAPSNGQSGELQPGGRLYLAAGANFYQLAGRDGQAVQFVLMPYPTASRYLDEAAQRYNSQEERHRALQAAFTTKLKRIQEHPRFRADLPTILAAHIHVEGAKLATPFRMSEQESIIFSSGDVPTGWAYVALGHIHQPQCLAAAHVRYSGSIERLDLGEKDDCKGVVLVEVGREGLLKPPTWLELDATPIYEARLSILDPEHDLPRVRAQYPDAARALVRYHLTYRGNLPALLKELDAIFPNWYDRDWRAADEPEDSQNPSPEISHEGRSIRQTVLEYLESELAGNPLLPKVTALADELLREIEP
jgi:exonuclease SbcD